ncbi:hypothetical protein [Roseomonas elaeocarpi]|uniref:Uncharacterized protein n=1 Tax=Roseomonas elaeocarpi TaxID=907779 RepID=A0ABV6JT83_9PROT
MVRLILPVLVALLAAPASSRAAPLDGMFDTSFERLFRGGPAEQRDPALPSARQVREDDSRTIRQELWQAEKRHLGLPIPSELQPPPTG